MNSLRLTLIGGVTAVVMACVGSASACGCGVLLQAPGIRQLISEVYEKALVTYHDGIETIVPGLGIANAGRHAAVVFPVPRSPSLRALPADLDVFGELEAATAPKPTETQSCPSGLSCATAPPPPLRVIAQKVIGGYQVTILRGGTGATLFAWLAFHGYALPTGATPILRTYAAEGWYFVALRLAHRAAGEIKPLAIAFRSSQIVYPMRLSAVATSPLGLELFVNADKPIRGSGLAGLATMFAGTVASLSPALSSGVLALLPGRYLTELQASNVEPASINSDVFASYVSPATVPPTPVKPASSGGSSPWPYIAIAAAVLAAAGLGFRRRASWGGGS
ncbi:MAG: DUF2330 domain-containing protein [Solirubrobacteraceae bacterium]